MLQFKAGCVDFDPTKYEAYADYSQKGQEYFYAVMAEDVNNKKLQWNKKLNHQTKDLKLLVWQRPSDCEDHIVRLDVFFDGIRINTVKTFLGDIENTMTMEDGEDKGIMKEFKILEKDDAGYPA